MGEVYPPAAAPEATRVLGGSDHPPLNPLPSREGKRVVGSAFGGLQPQIEILISRGKMPLP
jgi:hypothetical protein